MIHGCVPEWRADAQGYRNYVGERELVAFLRGRTRRYDHDRAALTVDDSTVGGARACLIAREEGHEVTLFLNPAQIERGRTYWFSRLDAMLDATPVRRLSFGGQEYDLDRRDGMRALRLAIKAQLMGLAEEDTDGLLDDLGRRMGTADAEVPAHGRTIARAEVSTLEDAGVRIGNHGWDHRDIAVMTAEAVAADVRAAADWFEAAIGAPPADYAVPYGLARLPEGAVPEVRGDLFLADPRVPLGEAAGHWNRKDITREIRDAR
jgi:peptidoglycan/xylan/chitin deacetylase (PgdA/CDA1 family)